MTNHVGQSREIDGKGSTVRELSAGRKYATDYSQRECKCQPKQVAEPPEDLAAKFLESHQDDLQVAKQISSPDRLMREAAA